MLGKLAKHVRKNDKTVGMAIYDARAQDLELNKSLVAELGDVLWQLQACCFELGVGLEDVAEYNLSKLSHRDTKGTIVGEGDNR